jgi:integrase/recombinase XerD
MLDNEFGFTSAMGDLLARHVLEKRVCGYQYGINAVARLRQLDRFFLAERGGPSGLGPQAYERFVAYREDDATRSPAIRAGTWRQFALFCRRQGLDAYAPERHDLPVQGQPYCPYIYSRREVAALFDAVERLPYRRSSPRRIPNFRLLFRLLYGTGLRLGEALRLTFGDMNRGSGVLTVRQGKNRKDRLVPLAPSLARRVVDHIDRYPGGPETPLFLSPVRSHEIDPETVEYAFRTDLRALAGLPPRVKNQGPRIHDLRHTFAVHRLENWFRAGEDVEAKLPYLSAYMGHAHVRFTYYYLRITASFFPEITRRFSLRVGNAVPEGGRP